MKIGLMGGTFDPIHHGHLVAAQEVLVACGLDRVVFVPAGHPPHKLGRVVTPASDRLAMVDLAIARNPGFCVSRLEIDRPGLSYTVDTIIALRGELGASAQLYFIIGLDSLAELLTWREPGRLVQLCQVIAVRRPGCSDFDLAQLEAPIPNARQRITLVDVPQLDIASSDLRRRVATGRPIKYQVPLEVERYIYERGLYSRK